MDYRSLEVRYGALEEFCVVNARLKYINQKIFEFICFYSGTSLEKKILMYEYNCPATKFSDSVQL